MRLFFFCHTNRELQISYRNRRTILGRTPCKNISIRICYILLSGHPTHPIVQDDPLHHKWRFKGHWWRLGCRWSIIRTRAGVRASPHTPSLLFSRACLKPVLKWWYTIFSNNIYKEYRKSGILNVSPRTLNLEGKKWVLHHIYNKSSIFLFCTVFI